MDMEGHTLYQIAALETTIKPKKAGSTLVINMDVMVSVFVITSINFNRNLFLIFSILNRYLLEARIQ
jgi:hypothetical protein